MTQQSHFWAYTPRKPDLKETRAPQCSSQHCLFVLLNPLFLSALFPLYSDNHWFVLYINKSVSVLNLISLNNYFCRFKERSFIRFSSRNLIFSIVVPNRVLNLTFYLFLEYRNKINCKCYSWFQQMSVLIL